MVLGLIAGNDRQNTNSQCAPELKEAVVTNDKRIESHLITISDENMFKVYYIGSTWYVRENG